MPKNRECKQCGPTGNSYAVHVRSYSIRDDDGHSVFGTISGGWVHEYRCRKCGNLDDRSYSSPYRDPDHDLKAIS